MYWMYRPGLCVLVMGLFIGVGCSDVDEDYPEPSPDDAGESAFAGGKADDLFGQCHLEHMVLLVNEADSDASTLSEKGVHARAADNIEQFRAGDDGEFGSEKDRYFRDVEQIDDVPYVGPVAMNQLAGAVDEYCDGQPWREVEVIFSPQGHGDTHMDRVVEMIDEAERSIDMAMYRISDNRAFGALEDAVDRGVEVRILFDEANGDHNDLVGSTSARLEELGADVRYVNRVMHHKFAIVDGPHNSLLEASGAQLFNGSGNLSWGAASIYDENTAFHQGDPALVLEKQREFNRLWEHSRNIEWNDELEYFETEYIGEEMIPHDDDLEVLFTSDNFEKTDHATWGPGWRPVDFKQSVADRLVEMIQEADSSVYLAASFLRSRPVTEALIQRWEDEPDLDVRVYLDQTEYVSQWYHYQQEDELEECLGEANGDESEVFDCEQTGFVFGYELVDAGIPVRFKTYSYRWHYTYAEQMHHKYMIIDGRKVATGSYNYSHNAERNTMENVVVYRSSRYPSVVGQFVDNFEHIWETGHDKDRFQELMDHVETADEIDLVFDAVALEHDEVTELREAIRERCPQVNDEPYTSHPEDHHSCEAQ